MQVQTEHGDEDFTVVGVMRGGEAAAQGFIAELGATYPVLWGAGHAFDEWGVTWLPQSYLIDPDGNVVADDLAAIDALLEGSL